MMLQVKSYKRLVLAALLIGAAGNAFAYGFFTINSAGERVQFASGNLKIGDKEHFQWSELNGASSVVPTGQRVLTQTEWSYLFQNRYHAYELYALATVNGEPGLVILPDYDMWALPSGLSFNYYATGDGYGKNIYDADQWTLMEASGAIFLPCRGNSSDGTTIDDATTHGTYWTSTEYAANDPYYIQFDDTYFYDDKHNSIAGGAYRSVRTVSAAPAILDENDEQEVFETKKTSLQSGSEAYIIRTLRKAGCFNTLTLPFNVPDIESSPLSGAEVYTFVSATVENNTLQLEIAPLVGSALTAGTPYLIQWDNTGEVLTLMHFDNITWDADNTADKTGTGDVRYIGFYGKTHISDDESHSNLFLAGGNELYWASDGDDEDAKMLGFRAYFNASTGGASLSPVRKGMPATLRIKSTPTDIDNVQRDNVQCTKVIRGGQLIIIIRNGEKYSINGQKL